MGGEWAAIDFAVVYGPRRPTGRRLVAEKYVVGSFRETESAKASVGGGGWWWAEFPPPDPRGGPNPAALTRIILQNSAPSLLSVCSCYR